MEKECHERPQRVSFCRLPLILNVRINISPMMHHCPDRELTEMSVCRKVGPLLSWMDGPLLKAFVTWTSIRKKMNVHHSFIPSFPPHLHSHIPSLRHISELLAT